MAASDYYRRPLLEKLLIKYSIKYANVNILVSKNEYEQIYKDWNLKNMIYSPHCIDIIKYSIESIISYKHFRFTFSLPVQQIVNNSFLLLQYVPLEYFIMSIQCGEYIIF